MRQLPLILVLSALADGTAVTSLASGFFKALAAAGFPATIEGLGGIIAAALWAFYSRWAAGRKLDRKVEEKLAKRLPAAVAAHLAKPRAKRKKINV